MSTSPTATAPGFIVAGTHSGVGKTTVTLTLLRALTVRGLRVQPFKIGPDFIDTAYHTEVAGRPSINLDLWMMGPDNVLGTFRRFSAATDVALIEAMGALYDGEDGTERYDGTARRVYEIASRHYDLVPAVSPEISPA
jgi:cobyrinic acid a,c-diamide synthase